MLVDDVFTQRGQEFNMTAVKNKNIFRHYVFIFLDIILALSSGTLPKLKIIKSRNLMNKKSQLTTNDTLWIIFSIIFKYHTISPLKIEQPHINFNFCINFRIKSVWTLEFCTTIYLFSRNTSAGQKKVWMNYILVVKEHVLYFKIKVFALILALKSGI